jgi:uncharacterized repeat protein (TIGR03803 family)
MPPSSFGALRMLALMGARMKRQWLVERFVLAGMLMLTVSALLPAQAQTFTVLYSFPGFSGDGLGPLGYLVQDAAGNLYGTTFEGGTGTEGTVFKINNSKKETVLVNFNSSNGSFPNSGLILDRDGNLYGPAKEGPGGAGVLFKVSPKGEEKLLYAFEGCLDCHRLRGPQGALSMDSAGNLYGAVDAGGHTGVGCPPYDCGALFKLDTHGKLHTLYAFSGDDGDNPAGPLLQDSAGNLYGTAQYGGDIACPIAPGQGCGTVYKLDTAGKFTVLYTFTGGSDGGLPGSALVMDKANNLYGVAAGGNGNCEGGCGVIFKLSPAGDLTVLHTFTGAADGDYPNDPLAIDAKGNLYGTTAGEFISNDSPFGSVFELTASGKFIVLHNLNGATDGQTPFSGPIRDAAGNLYGTAFAGGEGGLGNGTVFKVTLRKTH